MLDFTNFHDGTTANFTPCPIPDRAPDYTSASGSTYWHTGEGVIRASNHWQSGIRSCNWFLGGEVYKGDYVAGYCNYADFSLDCRECQTWRKLQSRWLIAVRKRQHEARSERKAIAVGNRITATRRVLEKFGRRYAEVVETITLKIAKLTAKFVVADDGRKFARHTLSQISLCG
jgi:hypothetical protein